MCPVDRLYARRPRRRSSENLPRGRLAVAKQWKLARRFQSQRLRNRAGNAPDLEVSDRAGACGYSRTGRLCGGGPVRPAQSMALGRAAATPVYRQERRVGTPRSSAAAARVARAAVGGTRRGNRALAPGQQARRRPGRGAGARFGWCVQALDLLRGSRTVTCRPGPRRLGGRRPRRKDAGDWRSSHPGGRGYATSPASICATVFWQWRLPASR